MLVATLPNAALSRSRSLSEDGFRSSIDRRLLSAHPADMRVGTLPNTTVLLRDVAAHANGSGSPPQLTSPRPRIHLSRR